MENPQPTYSLLDVSQIEMLLEDRSQESLEMFSEILELFEEECRSKLADLKAAKADNDPEMFGNASHTLAGSSANIGGEVVWKKAKAMENYCKLGDPLDAYRMLDEIEADFSETLIQLKAYAAKFQ